MDSLTQIALGAAIGEAVGGEEAGNKAMLWGGVAGLIPDLDIFMRPFYTQTEYLLAHRGISHSALFALLFSPLLAWMVFRLHRKTGMSYRKWWLLIFLAVFTHPLLDIMTTYGTGFLEPFSNVRLALGNINIVDPLYSLPLMATLIVIASARSKINARKWIVAALTFSHLYLALTFGNLLYMEHLFASNLKKHNITYDKLIVSTTFLNNLLWSGVALDEKNVYLGQYSHLDESTDIGFSRVKRNLHLAGTVPQQDFSNLVRFSRGYFALSGSNGSVRFHDLRFGYITPGRYIFNFDFSRPEERPFGRDFTDKDINRFFRRVMGEK